MYGYKWGTNWQNFTEIYLLLQKFTESKYCTKVLVGILLLTYTVCTTVYG